MTTSTARRPNTYPPEKIRSRTFAAILEISIENPLLTPQHIAALLGRDIHYVQAVMRSDAFLELRATKILERHGDKINGIRDKILSAADEAIDAIRSRIANPASACSEQTLLDATALLMRFVMPAVDGKNGAPDPANQSQMLNINLSLEDISNARAKQITHAFGVQAPSAPKQIDITPSPPRPAPLPARDSDEDLASIIRSAREEGPARNR
jgi:hypothetical protein